MCSLAAHGGGQEELTVAAKKSSQWGSRCRCSGLQGVGKGKEVLGCGLCCHGGCTRWRGKGLARRWRKGLLLVAREGEARLGCKWLFCHGLAARGSHSQGGASATAKGRMMEM